MFGGGWFLAGNQDNHQKFCPILDIQEPLMDFHRNEEKKIEKKVQNGQLKKTEFFKITNSKNYFVKIFEIGSWISKIDWCEGYWCGSTYIVVRLSDTSSKTGKNIFLVFLGCFGAYAALHHDHIGWARSMTLASINPTNPRTNLCKIKIIELAILKNSVFLSWPFWDF